MKKHSSISLVVVCDRACVGGGASKVAIETALIEKERGLDVTYFAAMGPVDDRLTEAHIKVICLEQRDITEASSKWRGAIQGIWNIKAYRCLRNLLSTLDADKTVVHVHSWTHALSPSIFAAISGYSCLITAHEYFLICPNGGLYDYKYARNCTERPGSIKCLLHDCDKISIVQKMYRSMRFIIQKRCLKRLKPGVIYISNSSKQCMNKYNTWSKGDFLCQNYVDGRLSETVTSLETGYPCGSFYLFVGRLSPEKGCDLFCKAAEQLKINAVVIGDGPEKRKLELMYPTVSFKGKRSHSEVIAWMSKAKALVQTSVCHETFGLVVYEGFINACLPCIVPDYGDVASFVKEQGVGTVYKSGSIASLIDAIKKFEKEEIYKSAKINLAKTDLHFYGREEYSDRLNRVYNITLQSKG